MICDKVQEMSFCVGSAVLRILDSQAASSLKKIDLLCEARNLLETEIKRLTKGEAKQDKGKASFALSAATRNADAAPKERKKRRTKAEMEAARNGGKPIVEHLSDEEKSSAVKVGEASAKNVAAMQTEIETDNKPAAKPKKKEKAPTPKAAPVLPPQDLETEDEEEFEDEEYEEQEERYPVGHFDDEEDETAGINV